MKTTTLNKIRACSPCVDSWEKLLKGLNKTQADDEQLAFKTILEICGLNDALWATRTAPEYNWRLLAVAFARRVQHLNPDPRIAECLNVAERYANGQATNEELREARDAAGAAAWEAERAAWAAAWEAERAAWAAERAAWAAERAAWAAAGAAERAAGAAAGAAAWEAERAAWEAERAAWAAERKEQEKLFIEFVSK